MYKFTVVLISVVCCFVLFGVFEYMHLHSYAELSRFAALLIFTMANIKVMKLVNVNFVIFLLLFTISKSFTTLSNFLGDHESFYYLSSSFSIMSYSYLILYLIQGLNVKKVITDNLWQILAMILFGGYSFYLLSTMIPDSFGTIILALEYLYYITLLVVLTIAFIKYLNNDSKSSFLLLLAVISIVFSEVIQLAYFYVLQKQQLYVAFTILLFMSLYFFSLRYKLEEEKVMPSVTNIITTQF